LAVNIGIIGYRNHSKRIINLLEKRKDTTIDYIFHPTKSLGKYSTNNLSDLYDCDAVFITSPNCTHFEYISEFLKNSKSFIFCEKIPVTNGKDLEKLEKLSKINKKKIFFNFNHRFSKTNDIIKKQILSSQIGDISNIHITVAHGLAFKKGYASTWRANKKNMHNLLETVSIHYVDFLNHNFGKIKEISYFPSNISKLGKSYDTNHTVIKYQSGIIASITNSYASPYINEISMIGTNGFFTLRNNNMILYSPRDTFDSAGFFKSPQIKRKNKFSMKNDYENSLKKSLNYFFTMIKSDKSTDLVHFQNSLMTNKLILNLSKKNHIIL
jgi:predicted dehydrogenase